LFEVVEIDRSVPGTPILEAELNLELLDSKEQSILPGLFIPLAGVFRVIVVGVLYLGQELD
jgi:hypothetical protein